MTRWPLLAVVVLLLGGCASVSTGVFQQGRAPTCEFRGQSGTPVVILEAQAVPSATLLPCVKLLAAGWSVSDVFIHNGRARFTLDSDRAGPHAVTVVLQRYCQLLGVTRVPSDEPGTRRYEQIGPLRSGVGFTGTRFYLFPGGCVSYRFEFRRGERAEPMGDVTLAISFVTRDAIRTQVRRNTGGRAELDPAGQGA
ncbi:MAG TPA: hypothetical protein VFA45_11840 [Actinomycetes bacterium]|nr:hypothetical protein [Actinomycetes bacterium]